MSTACATVIKYFIGTWTITTRLGSGEDVCGGGAKGSNSEKKQIEMHITSKLKIIPMIHRANVGRMFRLSSPISYLFVGVSLNIF